MIKSYLVNLDRSPERLEHIREVFAELGIDFTRIPAVDGEQLSPEDHQRWLSDKGTPFQLTSGELGCFLSHRRCWEATVAGCESHVAIFEDDIHLGKNAAEVLSRTDWIPADADIVKLETFLHPTQIGRKPTSMVCGRKIVRLWRTHFGTGGYIISRAAASKLISLSRKVSCPVDHFLFDPRFSGFQHLTIYQMSPALCVQELTLNPKEVNPSLKSTLSGDRHILGREVAHTVSKRIRREISRPFENFWRVVWLSFRGRKRKNINFV